MPPLAVRAPPQGWEVRRSDKTWAQFVHVSGSREVGAGLRFLWRGYKRACARGCAGIPCAHPRSQCVLFTRGLGIICKLSKRAAQAKIKSGSRRQGLLSGGNGFFLKFGVSGREGGRMVLWGSGRGEGSCGTEKKNKTWFIRLSKARLCCAIGYRLPRTVCSTLLPQTSLKIQLGITVTQNTCY